MEHDETRLPKWVQARMENMRLEIDRLKGVEAAHDLLTGREWFTIGGPPESRFPKDVRHLWWLCEDQPFPACSLFHGDVLIVGRSRHRWGGEPTPIVSGCGGVMSVA